MLNNPHVQATAQFWPNSTQLKQKLSFPLTISVQPFAHQHALSSIDPQNIHRYRCNSCKAFINQFCFIRSQNEYDCSICGCTNYVQQEIDIRMPELNHLSYRLASSEKHRTIKSKQRLIVFILDLTNYDLESKQYLLYSIHIIKEFVKTLSAEQKSINIMMIGFDSCIHRYTLNQNEQLQAFVSHGIFEAKDHLYFPSVNSMIGNSIRAFENIITLLEILQEDINNNKLRKSASQKILDAVTIGLRASQGYSGKIIVVSGIKNEVPQFKQALSKYFYDESKKHSFLVNKQECLKGQLQKLIQSTQMSLSFFFINSVFINNMAFHVMQKHTNGELRHYFPHQILFFFHQLKAVVQQFLNENTAYESILKVRYSTGLKLLNNFGNYRKTKIVDQFQLLTCPVDRKYVFEFGVQGKITSEFVVIQFSNLYTDLCGNRHFIIETVVHKVCGDSLKILANIDYNNVNMAYIRGIVHNLDFGNIIRNIQLGFQERCRKHFAYLRTIVGQIELELGQMKHQNIFQEILLKKVKPYIILTFLFLKHFLINQNYPNIFHHDLNVAIRSKVATYENPVNIIWPLAYAVKQNGWELIQMREKYIQMATVAIFIDRCDQYYCYLANPKLQAHLRTANPKEILLELIEKDESLWQLKKLIKEIKINKQEDYIDILPLEDLSQLKILDLGGQYGFDKFLSLLIQ